MRHATVQIKKSKSLLPLVMLACVSVGACAIDDTSEVGSAEEGLAQAALPPEPTVNRAQDAGVAVPGGEVGSGDSGVDSATLPHSGLTIRSVGFGNEGCPEAATKVLMSSDRSNFLVKFDAFAIAARPDFPFSDSTCNVRIVADVPAGYEYAIESFAASGDAVLGEGAMANVVTFTSFTGVGGALDSERRTKLLGPYDGPISLKETRAADALAFSGCRNPSVNVTLSLYAEYLTQGNPLRPDGARMNQFGPVKFAVRPCR